MTEAKQKAKEMVDDLGIAEAKRRCKSFIEVSYRLLQYEATIEDSHAFQYWGDVMDELNEMV